MAEPFKKQIVRSSTPDGRRCSAHTPGAVRTVELSRKWYGTVNGKPVPLCRDKGAAQKLLNKLLTDAALRPHGLTDPFEEHRKRPLADHLNDFRRELEARDSAPRYVAIVVSRLAALFAGCEFGFTADLDATKALTWLDDLRRKGRPRADLPDGQDLFTAREVGAMLGIKPRSVGTTVRRNRLEATGKGKKRRFPRATVEALQDRICQGVSVGTVNQYIGHLKAFGRWLVKRNRAAENPFASLEAGNDAVDRRHDRRELTANELRKLLSVTRVSERSFRGMTGPDRFHLYATACGTGFRASALASLKPEAFDLDADPPTVTLSARRNKSRVQRVQPLPSDMAELLRDYLAGKPADRPVWGGTWARDGKGAEMLRGDLDAAGIPYAVERPDGPLYADFHALRHSYITALGRGGVDLRTAQELAGHSTPVLTARYSHRRLYDLAGAVEKLPAFLPTGEDEQKHALRATGTEGRVVDPAREKERFGCSVVARTPGNQGHFQASSGTEEGGEGSSLETTQPLVSQGFCHSLASPVIASLEGG